MRSARAQELINTTDSPVEIRSIDMKQEDTKTGGMFLNKPSEVEIIQVSPHLPDDSQRTKGNADFFLPLVRKVRAFVNCPLFLIGVARAAGVRARG